MHAAGAERAVAALAASQHGAFGRRQAASVALLQSTMIATRFSSGVLREPIPGVLVFTSAPRTWRQDLMVATLVRQVDAIASHRAAAPRSTAWTASRADSSR